MGTTTVTPADRRAAARSPTAAIPTALISEVTDRLARNLPVRRTLPWQGRIHIDRQLPFLCVYRQPPDYADAGTERLVKAEASYLLVSGAPEHHASVSGLVRAVVKTLSAEFGAFLIVEVWAAPDGGAANDAAVPGVAPSFAVHPPHVAGLGRTVETLTQRLAKIRVLKQHVEVRTVRDGPGHPPGMPTLLDPADAAALKCALLGVEVPPVYRKAHSRDEFPLLMRSLRRSFALALRQTFFEFARSQTSHRPRHYHELGRTAVVKRVWEVDRQLAEVGNRFDYLLQVTPVNAAAAYAQFEASGFKRAPDFHYLPRPFDPGVLMRELYSIPIERVEDPALQRLFYEKQAEVDLKITMIRDRETPRFLFESLQLFGAVDKGLVSLARDLLARLPAQPETTAPRQSPVDAEGFAAHARREFAYYHVEHSGFTPDVRVTPEVVGLIVSKGNLLIGQHLSVPAGRVAALLAHEVGTHLVTYYNGLAQPFAQLQSGFAGYEELQEGLAVLAEYLVGGLTRTRVRTLAARVVAARLVSDGAAFVETFRHLRKTYGFSPQTAYSVTMRVHRGGGFIKDAIYLRGLRVVLKFVRDHGDLTPLFVGKISAEQIPMIKELLHRKVLRPNALLPRHMRDASALSRLAALRDADISLVELLSAACGGAAGPS